jgi:plasmid replication initiation protein
MSHDTKPHHHLIVVKSNHLVEAAYFLTLAEQRLLLLVIAKLDSRASLDAGICHTIAADELAAAYHLPNKQAYEMLRDAADRLFDRFVQIVDATAPQNSEKFRWVSKVGFSGDRRSVELHFTSDVIPFLSQLKDRFCRYHLTHVSRMTSSYAIRLYELLIQWREAGSRTVELVWLRERLQLGDKYPNIRDFKNRILNPAVDQINAHSDLWVKWEQHKRGRVVHALTFSFGHKADALLPSPSKSKPAKLTRAYVEQHALPGESWDDAWERCRRQIEPENAGRP